MQTDGAITNSSFVLRELEFDVGVVFSVSLTGDILIKKIGDNAKIRGQNVYVARRKSDGACIKIGMTSQSIWRRWKPIIDMVCGQKKLNSLRPNEIKDQNKLQQFCFGQDIEIWHRKSFDLLLSPDKGPQAKVNSTYLNEIYLDQLFNPLFGKDLSGRNT